MEKLLKYIWDDKPSKEKRRIGEKFIELESSPESWDQPFDKLSEFKQSLVKMGILFMVEKWTKGN